MTTDRIGGCVMGSDGVRVVLTIRWWEEGRMSERKFGWSGGEGRDLERG